MRPDTLLGMLGMENGDRLQTINGFDMTSPEKALEAYARLRTADHLTVPVNRKGAEHEPRLQHQVTAFPPAQRATKAMDGEPILKKTLVTVAVMVGAWVAFVGTVSIIAVRRDVARRRHVGAARRGRRDQPGSGKVDPSRIPGAPGAAGTRAHSTSAASQTRQAI